MNRLTVRTSSKKRDNKGFSLVELIIVIAIMAVLVAVLTPQLLKYVERSRLAKDNTNLDEIERSITIALTDEAVHKAVSTGTKVTLTPGTTTATLAADVSELQTEIGTIISLTPANLTASQYKGKTITWTITITNDIISITDDRP